MKTPDAKPAATHHDIVVCMGSSCYLRGNARNTEIIREYIEVNALDASVEFAGTLCSGQCKEGPVITIDGAIFKRVDAVGLVPLLRERLSALAPKQ
jgi:NADH:ubiquinone oxidoreductase subunit E